MASNVGLNLGNLIVHLLADITQFQKQMNVAVGHMQIVSNKMKAIGTQLSLAVTVPIVAIGAASTKAFATFDDAMTKSLAIMSDVTPQLRQEMEDLASEMAINGVVSANKLAEAYFFLASAGLDARRSMAALGAVQRFAVAGAFDMATATDLATDAQSALGLTVKDAQRNLENMTRVTDVLVGANTLANATTEQFSLALTSQAGPAMKAYGIELEEGVAVLAAFADQGIKAQNAGNLFSRMLRLMTKGFQDNREVWEQFGINIFDAQGGLKDLSVIVGDLSDVLNSLSTQNKILALDMLGFQARSQQAILPLLGLQDRIAKYNEQLKNMGGITRDVAEKQLASFASQMQIVKNNVVDAGIEIGKLIAPRLKELGSNIKNLTKGFKELNKQTKEAIIRWSLWAAAIGPALLVIAGLTKALLFLKTVLVVLVSFIIKSLLVIANLVGWITVLNPGLALFAALIGALIGSLAIVAIQANNVEVAFARLGAILVTSNDALRLHKKLWEDISDVLQETSRGRFVSAQAEIISRQLEQRRKQLEFIRKEHQKTGIFGKIVGGAKAASIANRLIGEISVLERRLNALSKQGREAANQFMRNRRESLMARLESQMAARRRQQLRELLARTSPEESASLLRRALTTFGTGAGIGGLSVSGLQLGGESVLQSIAQQTLEEQKESNFHLERISQNTEWE